jgi:SAM-dependent MidA family methyltransferase
LLFGHLSFWKSLGSPKKFNLIELGAGNGEMMKVIIESFKNFHHFKMLVILLFMKKVHT